MAYLLPVVVFSMSFLIFTLTTTAQQYQTPTAYNRQNASLVVASGNNGSSEVTPSRNGSLIRLGSLLYPVSQPNSWTSPSGLFSFGFYPQGDGFSVGIWLVNQPNNTVVWTSNRDDPPVSSEAVLNLTTSGLMLLQRGDGVEKLIVNATGSANSASMLDSGNFVIYDSDSASIWESFGYPTDTLLGGQTLLNRGSLIASVSNADHSSGRFRVEMQNDGNLVWYPVNTFNVAEDSYKAYWFVRDDMPPNLSLNTNGLLSVVKPYASGEVVAGVLVNSSSPAQGNVVYRATLDPDGIFRFYVHLFENKSASKVSVEWYSPTNQCDVKGFCGLNGYCSSTGEKGDCYCFPGFVPVSQDQKLPGCSLNFSEDFLRKDLRYNMTKMENVWWYNDAYYVMDMSREDCSESCEEDYYCGAALYDNNSCKKYKLPLVYGKRNENLTAVAFIKLISGRIEHVKPPIKFEIRDRRGLIMILAISLGSLAFFSLLLAVSSLFMYSYNLYIRKKRLEDDTLRLAEEFTLKSFSYTELDKATDGFKEKLGNGSFGAVYRGTIAGGNKVVAVKRLEMIVEEGERKFQAEMTSIGRTHHRNLVQLVGFCIENSRKLLVYEFMSKGSLADVLFRSETRPSWNDRVKIAQDVARGIYYLHEECEVPILHCSIKPQNILIDDSWTAKIADFGLAQLQTSSRREMNMQVGVTSGYLAPEQRKHNFISVKADIYSFGIVLFEIICCRRNIEIHAPEDEIILSSWVRNCFEHGKLDALVKDENVEFSSLERVVKVGLRCIQDDPSLRPLIKDVILMLEGTVNVLVPSSN